MMSTLKSSGYRSWSTRTFQPNLGHQGQHYQGQRSNERSQERRSHDRSHDRRSHDLSQRSHDQSQMLTSNNGGHLRLHLTSDPQGHVMLDLSHRDLYTLPLEVFLFSRLEVLKLPGNYIQEMPLAVSRLRSLKYLYIEQNRLTFLPETISNCMNLIEVNLTHNKLSTLPTNFGMLRNLRVLRLGQNEFECLPHELGMLHNLRFLDLQGNSLWYLPFSLGNLHKLKYLNLSNNRFEHLPLPVCKITSLQTLSLRGNNLVNLLPDFDNLKNLQELNLSYNKFEMIPQCVFRLCGIRYLNLSGNCLQTLPKPLTAIKGLKVLHAQCNQISQLPEMLPNLQYLNISHNQLYNFSIVHMRQLKSLNASYNLLENVPMGVYSTPRLQTIRLDHNHIQYISPDIANLRRLKTLDLSDNLLVNVPHSLHKLDRLDFFSVRNNALNDRVKLRNGEIAAHSDIIREKKRIYENRQNGRSTYGRHRSNRKSRQHKLYQRSKSLDGLNKTNHQQQLLQNREDNAHKMWDSEDLLQNGFSERHLATTSNSAFLEKKLLPWELRVGTMGTDIFQHQRAHQAALRSDTDDTESCSDAPVRTTDYQLLGICNQVEMMLNKQLLHPVLSLRGHDMGKSFSEKAIVKTPSGLWRISDGRGDTIPPDLVAMTTETFTVTPQGGWLTSSHDQNISLFLPPNAVNTLVQAQMKILHVEPKRLNEMRLTNKMVSNILSLGPIVYLKNLDGTDFNHQITITIPAPPGEKRGHLQLITIKEDNSCVPAASGFKVKSGYIVLRAWNLVGKAAVITRGKCKYKACTSMEQLLAELVSPVSMGNPPNTL